ncbi:MAG: hypothetical protein CML29_05035 [Rhizobiales bacterium]|nr:hypothetical protein [Hyphomicrobiales bacterium]MBA71019.1 hypothetical protein [Hyphomicrobiales bacterium]
MTGVDHQHSAAVEQAAMWLAEQQEPPKPAVPFLRRTFGLSTHEACEACSLANRFRINRRSLG